MSFMNITFEMIYHVVLAYMDAIGILLVPIGMAIVGLFYLIYIFGWLNIGNFRKIKSSNEQNELSGKNFIFLGSSVTKGMAAYGKSFVDMIAARNHSNVIKEAVSGTTLVEKGKKNYITRLKKIDKNTPCDVFICQLSTNDATKRKPLGTISDSKDIDSFDTQTVCGAIEYIIAYAKETWNCPVVFYTNPYYTSKAYARMVEALDAIAEKWEIDVVRLWNNEDINMKFNRISFRNDEIHPTRKGYEAITPIFEQALKNVLEGKKVDNVSGDPSDKIKKSAKKKKIFRISISIVMAAIIIYGVAFGICGLLALERMRPAVLPGNNAETALSAQTPLEERPLEGKKILSLGSSVALGWCAERVSFSDYIELRQNCDIVKDAISGSKWTSDTNTGLKNRLIQWGTGFVPRLKKYDASDNFDAILIQISSNDATLGSNLGEISDSFNSDDFDLTTYVGSVEATCAYAKETWPDAVVIAYSGTAFREKDEAYTAAYRDMVHKTEELTGKWDNLKVLNMFEDEELNAKVDDETFKFYMSDDIHPTQAGYLYWWTPAIEEFLIESLAN